MPMTPGECRAEIIAVAEMVLRCFLDAFPKEATSGGYFCFADKHGYPIILIEVGATINTERRPALYKTLCHNINVLSRNFRECCSSFECRKRGEESSAGAVRDLSLILAFSSDRDPTANEAIANAIGGLMNFITPHMSCIISLASGNTYFEKLWSAAIRKDVEVFGKKKP